MTGRACGKRFAAGRSAARRLDGLPGIPDGLLLGAPVDIEPEIPGQLKAIALCQRSAAEAIERCGGSIFAAIDRESISPAPLAATWATPRWVNEQLSIHHLFSAVPWWHQWLPNTACSAVANRWGLYGPRLCHSTACASGLIDIIAAVRALADDQCDIALAGSAEAFHPLFAAGFHQMRVLAYHDDPRQACRPFDETRDGFIMGEGAAMFVLERLTHARRRGARIYAEILGGKTLADAHHLTGVDLESDTLARLISETLRASGLKPRQLEYINAHGTGTQQNDLAESRGIRRAMGPAADALCVSATKSILGPSGQCGRQRRAGHHHAGHARRLSAPDAESHPARSAVRSGLHSAGRSEQPVRPRHEAVGRLRRPSGGHCLAALERDAGRF